MRFTRTLQCFVVLQLLLRETCGSTCFWPSRSNADPLRSCSQDTKAASHCCDKKDICLNNGYCFTQDYYSNRLVRGGCTDMTWGSSACPTHCTSGRSLRVSHFQVADLSVVSNNSISILLVVDSNPGMYCCGDGYNVTTGLCYYPDDDNSFTPFSIPNSHVIIASISGKEGSAGFSETAKIVCGVLGGLLGAVCASFIGYFLFRRIKRAPDNAQSIVRY